MDLSVTGWTYAWTYVRTRFVEIMTIDHLFRRGPVSQLKFFTNFFKEIVICFLEVVTLVTTTVKFLFL